MKCLNARKFKGNSRYIIVNNMLFDFKYKELKHLYETGSGPYSEAVKKAFFRKMAVIKAAKDENVLRSIKGNHFEKLKDQKNKYSIRLNDQYRLIFAILKDNEIKILMIEEISNHYS